MNGISLVRLDLSKEWRVCWLFVFCLVSAIAPGEAETELVHLHSVGVIYVILSDHVDILFGVKTVIRKSISLMTAMTVLKAYPRPWHPR